LPSWNVFTLSKTQSSPSRRRTARQAPRTEKAIGEFVSALRDQLADVKAGRDHWREISARLPISEQRERRPWWKRLAG
jgi:hypothetical protein